MGIDIGFDLYPPLASEQDLLRWTSFLESVRAKYSKDPTFRETPIMIQFQVGEYPRLMLDGTRFRRFSSKVGESVETLIRDIQKMAVAVFGSRIHPWNEYDYGPSGSGAMYSWTQVYDPES